MKYLMYTPDISRYTAAAHAALDAGWISSQGEYINRARDLIKNRVGTPYWT